MTRQEEILNEIRELGMNKNEEELLLRKEQCINGINECTEDIEFCFEKINDPKTISEAITDAHNDIKYDREEIERLKEQLKLIESYIDKEKFK